MKGNLLWKRAPAIWGCATPSPDTAVAGRIAFLGKLCVHTLGTPSGSAAGVGDSRSAGAGANPALLIGRRAADVAVAGLAFVCAVIGKLCVHTLGAPSGSAASADASRGPIGMQTIFESKNYLKAYYLNTIFGSEDYLSILSFENSCLEVRNASMPNILIIFWIGLALASVFSLRR